ncbi:unnamed protein product [Didymodactylos carnosus]|uniref:Uncharacterized protein n=1 Tax=Didymodactylos carnosus TaxID=1234261 RepID=A0A814CX27_9BILA|nr:unnamed protein product [Didymodactylos carnosus]CAF3721738.1 unnamed protein product [Didymodactylos carnosus]
MKTVDPKIKDKMKDAILNSLKTDETLRKSIHNMIISHHTDDQNGNDVRQKQNFNDDNGSNLAMVADKVANLLLKPVLKHFEECLSVLEAKINDLKRYNRTFCIRLLGISKEATEDTTLKIVSVINNNLDMSITTNDIENSHRIGKRINDKNRPIIARLYSRSLRLQILRSAYKLQGKNLNISIVEDLTKRALTLFQNERSKLNGDRKKSIITRNGRDYRVNNDKTLTLIT